MATALTAGFAVAAAALAGRYSIQAWQAYKARPIVPRMRKFYEGGFQATMTRREAGLILGVSTGTPLGVREQEWVKERIRTAQHTQGTCLDLCPLPSDSRGEFAFTDAIPKRENVHPEKVKEAHKRVMVANHPDAGGSHYLASKINEAKDVLLGKTKGGGSAF